MKRIKYKINLIINNIEEIIIIQMNFSEKKTIR